MKKVVLFVFCILFLHLSTQTIAQMPPSRTKEVAAKVIALPIKPGEWVGKANMQMGTNKYEVDQWENITYMLDSTVILIEGIGKTDNVIRHHAMATLSYDPVKQSYQFRSFKDGYITDADCKLQDDGKFEWSMKNPSGTIRYIIWLENDEWRETGEFSADGKTWNKFLEMKLHKK